MTRSFAIVFALLIAVILFAVCVATHADTLGNTNALRQDSTSAASNQGVTVTSVASPALPWTASSIDYRTNQAMSGPAVIGNAAPSSGGCPVVDGWSVSVVFANGGKSKGSEMPGCMLNLLTDRLPTLKVVKDPMTATERFDGMSVMKLEAWCLLPLYKQAIENSGVYVCKETRDEQARREAVAIMAPHPQVYAGDDPLVIARLQHQGRLPY